MRTAFAKLLAIGIVLTLVGGVFAIIAPVSSAPSNLSVKDVRKTITPERDLETPKGRTNASRIMEAYSDFNTENGTLLAQPADIYRVGQKALYNTGYNGKWYYNETNPSDYMIFTKRAESNHSELWTADDMTFPEGDFRNTLTSQLVITDAKALYMVNHFEKVIYPNMTTFFGELPSVDGSNSVPASEGLPYFSTNLTGHLMIMVFNIVDGNFFDPEYPRAYYGFFDPWASWFYDRNIINVDCWDWTNRTTGNPPYPATAKPWDFESTIAHELQHIINYNANPNQAVFLNEGCSMFAEILCGYSVQDMDYVNKFLHTPDVSLVDWQQQGEINFKASYGGAMLFVTWLKDHFGGMMIKNIVNSDGTSGISSVDYAFVKIGKPDWNYEKAFQYWRLANLILADSPGGGWYNYKSIDVAASTMRGPAMQVWSPSVESSVPSAAEFFDTTSTYDGYTTGIREVGAYGTEYIHVTGLGSWSGGLDPSNLKFSFVGASRITNGWQLKRIARDTNGTIYSEDFNHGGSMAGWNTFHPIIQDYANVYGGGPWHTVQGTLSDYSMAVNGPSSLGPSQLQNDAVISPVFSTKGNSLAEISFNLNFAPGDIYDSGMLKYSVDGGPFVTLESWTTSVNENVTLDFSALTGFSQVELMFDFQARATGGHMSIDDLTVSSMSSQSIYWSGSGDMKDYGLANEIDLNGLEHPVLSLDTKWSIEDNYDFGFVQVSTDGGVNWTSVANEYTTFDNFTDVQAIMDSLPGITGSSGGWVTANWDLSEWAGQKVMLRLRYMTDEATNYDGWFVRGANLNGMDLPLESWHSQTPQASNTWLVTIYLPGAIGLRSRVYMLPIMVNLNLEKSTQAVLRTLTTFTDYRDMYILISPVSGTVDYGFGIESV